MSDTNGWLGVGMDALTGMAKGAAAGSVVPGLGTVGGGLIGLATALVPHVFGTDSAPLLHAAAALVTGKTAEADQLAEMSGNPAATENFRLEALKIAQDERVSQREADQALMDARFADVAKARQQTVDLATVGSPVVWEGVMVDAFVLALFGACVLLVMLHGMPDAGAARDLTSGFLATLGTLAVTIVQYWRGSSAGSARKDTLLANSVPSALLPHPAALVPVADVPQ